MSKEDKVPEHSETCKNKKKELNHCCKYWCTKCKGDTTAHAQAD